VLAGGEVLIKGLMHVPQKRDASHNGRGKRAKVRIIDRYVIRQVLLPFVIGLLVFTFIIIIPFLIEQAETLIAKGVGGMVVLQLMATLLPQALGLTIPMSLLLGLLVAFGRLSSDREFVAMQACGVSLMRLLRPVALLSLLGWAATSYVLLVAVPSANQNYREITYNIVAARAEGEVKPRVFFDDFPDLMLYVRDVPQTGAGWNDVFMADSRPGSTPAIYLARHGRVLLNREKRTVEIVLEQGARHTADAAGKYEVFQFRTMLLSLNPETVFPRTGPAKGEREMSIPELRVRAAELVKQGDSPHNPLMEIQKKFSIPVACLVFGLIGLALGASNRRDGKLASFVLGIGVIFIYYVLLYVGQAMAKGQMTNPWLAVWLPNLVLGAAGGLLFLWRDRAADKPLRIALPEWLRKSLARLRVATGAFSTRTSTRATMFGLPRPTILDRYIALTYARVFGLAAVGMAGLFYISTFLDLSDKLFKGTTTWRMLGEFMWYMTPQYIYYVLPMSVLLAALVTIGILTKNSELVVMKACGISLYRVALPMVASAVIAGGVLFGLEETILGPSNRRAEAIRHVMRGGSPQTFDVLSRRWLVGSQGQIYHYDYFDPRTRRLMGLTTYEFGGGMRGLVRRSQAERATYLGDADTAETKAWRFDRGWLREFDREGHPSTFAPFSESDLDLEPVSYFATQQPDPKFMSYSQLRGYITRLRASGFDVIEQQVALERKISFPFVTLIMTLIAVPFAVTTGSHGALYGVGVGIVLAISYWVAASVFAALGSGGLLAPPLAAWAPNLLFGAGAAYLLLTAKT
jgi:LPS export ABC transporter permease LptG/LPS export ABC transporter permease LptF